MRPYPERLSNIILTAIASVMKKTYISFVPGELDLLSLQ